MVHRMKQNKYKVFISLEDEDTGNVREKILGTWKAKSQSDARRKAEFKLKNIHLTNKAFLLMEGVDVPVWGDIIKV